MASRASNALVCTGLAASLCACASMNESVNTAGGAVGSGAGAVYHGGATVYRTGSSMVGTTVGETYNGLGGAVRRPFQDFNLMQDKVPDQLEQAIKNPYDTKDLTSCEKINARVAALDVVLGPDLDTPAVEDQRDRWHKGASSAADYAVAAATDAADHFIPVRGVIRQISGATKSEKHAKKALLAGSVRRGFLKAVGMQQGCGWPAAPVDFNPQLSVVHRQHAEVAPSTATGVTFAVAVANAVTIPAPTVAVAAASPSSVPVQAENRQAGVPVPARLDARIATAAPAGVVAAAAPPAPATVVPASASPIQALATPPAQAQDYARAETAVRVAQRAAATRPARRGVVERAPIGQSVTLPPRPGESQTSSAADRAPGPGRNLTS